MQSPTSIAHSGSSRRKPFLPQLSDLGCSLEALAASSFLIPALSFSQVVHQECFCVSNYILVVLTVDPGSGLRKPVIDGVWGLVARCLTGNEDPSRAAYGIWIVPGPRWQPNC